MCTSIINITNKIVIVNSNYKFKNLNYLIKYYFPYDQYYSCIPGFSYNTVGNTVGNTAGNTVGNTAGNTVGNTAGNTVGNTAGNQLYFL